MYDCGTHNCFLIKKKIMKVFKSLKNNNVKIIFKYEGTKTYINQYCLFALIIHYERVLDL